jgi:hypothetical protein
MNVFYSVKQLAHEIGILEAQLVEKKTVLEKLWPLLSHQEQLTIDSPSMPTQSAPSGGKPAAPKEKPKKAG